MADTKLSDLTELAEAPALTDESYIRDTSEAAADESKRISVANYLAAYDAIVAALTNKSIDQDGTGNSITNLADASIKEAAAIAVNKLAAQTVSEIAIFDASGFLTAAAVATYPSLAELIRLKGVTSPIQTQMDAKLANLSEDATPQAAGELDLQANSIGGTVQTAVGDGSTTIDWGTGNLFNFTFGAFNETFTFTNPTKPGVFVMKLLQDSVGSRTATWPASVKWPSGTAPTLTTTATTGTDVVTFYFDGTDYFAVSSADFS